MKRRIEHKDVMRAWRAHLEIERDIAHTTVLRYDLHVRNWLTFIGRKRRHFSTVTRDDCASWWQHIKAQSSSSTCVQVLCALRQFYDWAIDREYYDSMNIWHRFQRPTVTHGVRPVISEDDMYQLIHTSAIDTWMNVRNRTIVAFLYATGLRVSECAGVSIHELDLSQRVCYVRFAKGKKTRKQPVPTAIVPALEEWLDVRSLMANGTGALFVNRSGKRLGPQGIRDATKAWCAAAGLRHLPMNPHVLRKSACTHIYEHGRDIHAVQRFANHSRPDTTQRYIANADTFVSDTVESLHPLARWEKKRRTEGA